MPSQFGTNGTPNTLRETESARGSISEGERGSATERETGRLRVGLRVRVRASLRVGREDSTQHFRKSTLKRVNTTRAGKTTRAQEFGQKQFGLLPITNATHEGLYENGEGKVNTTLKDIHTKKRQHNAGWENNSGKRVWSKTM